ncbi:hypothetical protein LZ554_002649 [Drepanopeziza brunnea f. sp. 'monogermtubi']|nr:hypothetical protein LZ554_002649 [Drepanopeziza brunnea f. sp. 'monogermtubi']
MPSATETPGFQNVIIVGAGPAGLLLGLMLSKKGIPVRLLDAAETLDTQPRATHYQAAAVHELNRAGVLEEVQAQGFLPETVCWRKLDGEEIAGLSSEGLDLPEEDKLHCLPLDRLGKILQGHLLKQKTAKILWNHKVTGISQTDEKAFVDVETPDGPQKLEADYIIGCDGANSQIRKSLFGDWEFPGRTWDEQIVATNTYYPFDKFGYKESNFIIHPEHWYMAARISTNGLWRVTYGETPGLTKEELLARQPEKFKKILPGYSGPDCYKLANFSPYKVHQRLAKHMVVGRFILAADAAHLCNPFGGLGLTGGIVDVGGLYDCLVGIYERQADPSILAKYDEIRREKYNTFVDPVSTANLRLLFETDPDTALESNEFLKMCKRAETDRAFAMELQQRSKALQYDFTTEYGKAVAVL